MSEDLARKLDDIFGDTTDDREVADASLAIDLAVQFAALRERRGLSQQQLADKLGRTQQAISKIENPSHAGHNLARLKEAVAAMDAYLDVTIVPLEDAAAYQALYPPKPVLEDVGCRGAAERGEAKARGNRRARTTRRRASARHRPTKARVNVTGPMLAGSTPDR